MLLHLRAGEGVGLATTLYQHLPVAQYFADRGGIDSSRAANAGACSARAMAARAMVRIDFFLMRWI